MAIKLVEKDNVSKLPKNKWTMKEVLNIFEKRLLINGEESKDENVINAVIMYQTNDGFSYSTLNFDTYLGLLGVIELVKARMMDEYLDYGLTYTTDEADDEDN